MHLTSVPVGMMLLSRRSSKSTASASADRPAVSTFGVEMWWVDSEVVQRWFQLRFNYTAYRTVKSSPGNSIVSIVVGYVQWCYALRCTERSVPACTPAVYQCCCRMCRQQPSLKHAVAFQWAALREVTLCHVSCRFIVNGAV